MTAGGARKTAKLFMHGRSQAVRLPKEFRFEGTEVLVSREGDRVVLEPAAPPRFDVRAWLASVHEAAGGEFLPEGRPEQPPMPPDEDLFD